ncbi:MAG: MBL fold metallo-hydrolase [Lachnospiraceae bacterium]|nr:MBL fold metallo-hydrolase [Lachnospiraceae bacterium]
MKITYIEHSGFLVELENTYLLFDYYKGKIPALVPEKKLFIFASHKHPDHYNFEIWKWKDDEPKPLYVLSKDCKPSAKRKEALGITDLETDRVCYVAPNQNYDFPGIKIQTLRSTDEGVAFAVACEGKDIYHAGDLNLWVWREESKTYNEEMEKNFWKEMNQLSGRHFDLAFVPLDPRQEEDAFGGMDAFCQTAQADHIFPMHFWGQPEIITRYKENRKENDQIKKIVTLKAEGEHHEF